MRVPLLRCCLWAGLAGGLLLLSQRPRPAGSDTRLLSTVYFNTYTPAEPDKPSGWPIARISRRHGITGRPPMAQASSRSPAARLPGSNNPHLSILQSARR
jgi:hypothetical protein